MAVGGRSAVVILDGDRVLLMRRRKRNEDYYVVPGGGIEPGETPEDAASREAKEETGLDVELARKLSVSDDAGRPVHYFLVTRFDGEPRVGGPERDRMSPENRYDLEWIDVRRLRGIGLRPASAVAICEDALPARP